MKFFMHRINPISILKCFIHFLRFKMGMIAWVSNYIQGFRPQSHIIIHVTSQSKFKKKKLKKGSDLMGTRAPLTLLFPTTHHTPTNISFLISRPPTLPHLFCFFFSQTHTPPFTASHSHGTHSTPLNPPSFFWQGSLENSLGTSKAPSSLLI